MRLVCRMLARFYFKRARRAERFGAGRLNFGDQGGWAMKMRLPSGCLEPRGRALPVANSARILGGTGAAVFGALPPRHFFGNARGEWAACQARGRQCQLPPQAEASRRRATFFGIPGDRIPAARDGAGFTPCWTSGGCAYGRICKHARPLFCGGWE